MKELEQALPYFLNSYDAGIYEMNVILSVTKKKVTAIYNCKIKRAEDV